MFETAVVRERAVAQRRYPLLVASVGVHSLIVVAIVIVGIHAVTLPTHPPNEIRMWNPVMEPPPPPAAPPQQQHAQQQPVQPHAAVVPHAATAPATVVAPTKVPDAIPTVAPSSSVTNLVSTGDPNASASSNVGGPGIGDPNSGGSDSTATDTVPVPDTIFHPGGEVRPATVLHRLDPAYPRAAINIRLGATVVLKCVIDRNGNVRDAEVVTSSHPAFNEPALAALRQWRFAPGVFHGKPVDTFFELTIRFEAR